MIYYSIRRAALYVLIGLFFFPASARADTLSEEEGMVLALFYKEKELVITPTRNPTPVSKVAENITIVTARQIEKMNAHSVAEVLRRVSGLFVNSTWDFGATSLFIIQGSEPRHISVFVDGIPWNLHSDGSAETNAVPVEIIDRIELVKGPASSAWGSALGGIINIITKPAGITELPTGSLHALYGEKSTQEYCAQVKGHLKTLGYYLFAGKQKSDGLLSSRYFDKYTLYSKFDLTLSNNGLLCMSLGYSQPDNGLGDFPEEDISTEFHARTSHARISLEYPITKDLTWTASVYHFNQKSALSNNALGLGFLGPLGDLFLETISDEKTLGGRSKLVLSQGPHTVVLGFDFDHTELDSTQNSGLLLQSHGIPASSKISDDFEQWAVYVNDTITLGRWTVTPGLRYDDNSISGSFLSPSLGLTCQLHRSTVLRASVARGFTNPPFSATTSGGLFLDPNPDLDPEEVWSYQLGLESGVFEPFWIKGTLFRHDLDKALIRERFAAGPPTFNDLIFNKGEIRRQGFEIEAQTLPIHHISLYGGFAFVDVDPPIETGSSELYSFNIGINYDNHPSLQFQLHGNYIWWDTLSAFDSKYDTFIWQFHLSKRIYKKGTSSVALLFTAHNIFNGSQYIFGDQRNPGRWVEAGVRFSF